MILFRLPKIEWAEPKKKKKILADELSLAVGFCLNKNVTHPQRGMLCKVTDIDTSYCGRSVAVSTGWIGIRACMFG